MTLEADHPYKNTAVAIVSKHSKEKAIAKPLRVATGCDILAYSDFDTDELGTFTGEIERAGSPEETVRAKAEKGLDDARLRLGPDINVAIATEGSFGPHPQMPIIPGHHEIIYLVDRLRNFSLKEDYLAFETNYCYGYAETIEEVEKLASRCRFPSHGIVIAGAVKPERALDKPVLIKSLTFKGITEHKQLISLFDRCRKSSDATHVWLESDMRAHMNPTRMRNIRRTAIKLARRLASRCPECSAVGFGQTGKEAGLLCANCRRPTMVVGWYINSCWNCEHSIRISKYESDYRADPTYCDYCNP